MRGPGYPIIIGLLALFWGRQGSIVIAGERSLESSPCNKMQMPETIASNACTSRPASQPTSNPAFSYTHGGIVRGARDRKRLALIFTGGNFGESTGPILDILGERKIKASFFVTGDYLRKSEHQGYLRRIVAEGHYLGPHSDSHPLYCPWEDRNKTLISHETFTADLTRNLADLARYGLNRESMQFFIPPYEWYNDQIVQWSRRMGLTLFNFSPGTRSGADYMADTDPRFISSQKIRESILDYEARQADGLNGFVLLFHLGSGPERTDKMHRLLPSLIDELTRRGYKFVRVDGLLDPAQ